MSQDERLVDARRVADLIDVEKAASAHAAAVQVMLELEWGDERETEAVTAVLHAGDVLDGALRLALAHGVSLEILAAVSDLHPAYIAEMRRAQLRGQMWSTEEDVTTT